MTVFTRSGSVMSIEMGPTVVTVGSSGARPEANTERWTPSCSTLNAASRMPRFG